MTPAEIAARLTRAQRVAMRFLGRGGARYGTRYPEMVELRRMGLCAPHDKGAGHDRGRWTWRPTPLGRQVAGLVMAEHAERERRRCQR